MWYGKDDTAKGKGLGRKKFMRLTGPKEGSYGKCQVLVRWQKIGGKGKSAPGLFSGFPQKR